MRSKSRLCLRDLAHLRGYSSQPPWVWSFVAQCCLPPGFCLTLGMVICSLMLHASRIFLPAKYMPTQSGFRNLSCILENKISLFCSVYCWSHEISSRAEASCDHVSFKNITTKRHSKAPFYFVVPTNCIRVVLFHPHSATAALVLCLSTKFGEDKCRVESMFIQQYSLGWEDLVELNDSLVYPLWSITYFLSSRLIALVRLMPLDSYLNKYCSPLINYARLPQLHQRPIAARAAQ